jgi:hypothetical protein
MQIERSRILVTDGCCLCMHGYLNKELLFVYVTYYNYTVEYIIVVSSSKRSTCNSKRGL